MDKRLLTFLIYFIAILLSIYWYDYKLAVLIIIFNAGQNIENSIKNK